MICTYDECSKPEFYNGYCYGHAAAREAGLKPATKVQLVRLLSRLAIK